MTNKILITGVAGHIGTNAANLFLQKGYEVVAIDNFATGYKQPVEILEQKFGKKQFHFYERDLKLSFDDVLDQEKGIEAVVHYAASCVVSESMVDPNKYFYNNAFGTYHLLSSMLKHGLDKIIFSSTCTVYDEAKYIPIDEKHPLKSHNPYGSSKRMAEEMIEWNGALKGLRYVILRYFNVCGASDDGVFGYSKKPATHLMENAVRGALDIQPFYLTYKEVDTKDKSPIRDFVNVVDLNEAHVKAVDYLLQGGESQHINLGTGTGNSVLEIVNKVQELTGKQFDVKKATAPREGESAVMIASIEKAKKLLGWEPKRSIEDSVKSLLKWFGERPNGWEY